MKKTIIMSSLLIMAGIALTIVSCKKSSTSPGTTSNNTNNSNGFPSGTYSGLLVGAEGPTGSGVIGSGIALFFPSPVTMNGNTMSAVNTATVSAVSMNGNAFAPFFGIFYLSTTASLTFPPAAWTVTGSGSIPSFTYTNTNPLPTYTGISKMPSTIIRANNLTLSITGVSNSDQIEVEISDSTGKQQQQYISSNASSITFVSDSLEKLSACHSASINVTCVKYNPQTLSGKGFLFATEQVFQTSNNIILK